MDATLENCDSKPPVNKYLEMAKRKRPDSMPDNLKERYDQVVAGHITRAARIGEPRKHVPGPPLELRLVVSELRDETGQVIAVWYLEINVDVSIDKAIIVLWYYWRWRVESYHKLLKSEGQHVES